MKTMTRFLLVVIALAFVYLLTACGNQWGPNVTIPSDQKLPPDVIVGTQSVVVAPDTPTQFLVTEFVTKSGTRCVVNSINYQMSCISDSLNKE